MKKNKTPQSIKDILISKNFLEAQEKAGKYISQEFQDYAYRLANDLGDLQHKAIYMKLAKTVDRSLLEMAAAFALGYFDEPNKGKLFMWKVSQLRRMAKQKQDMKNTEHSFVMQRMAEIIDELSGIYSAAQKRDHTPAVNEFLNMFATEVMKVNNQETPNKLRVLVIGCGIGLESAYLHTLGFNTHGVDISRKLVRQAKQKANSKMIRKPHLLENKYKDGYFHGVFIPSRMWEIIPVEAEPEYYKEIERIRAESSVVALQFSEKKGVLDSEVRQISQGWEEFDWQEQKYIRFKKYCSALEISKRLGIDDYKMLTANTLLFS